MTEANVPAAENAWGGGPYSTKRHGATITNCDAEPIRTPGCIQCHGALLALRRHDLLMVQVSENVEHHLGRRPEQLLQRSVDRLFNAVELRRVRHMLAAEPVERNPTYALTFTPSGGEPLDVSLHTIDDVVLLEFEPTDRKGAVPLDYYALVKHTLARLQAAGSLRDFCQILAQEVRVLTGLDRVMVYRFHADHSGEVFAESVRADLPAWLGLRYPADDIPLPAREIYKRLWVRPVPNAESELAELVPLLNPETGRPLELTHAALRGASVMYTEYIRNMGVAASLTMPLLRDGEVWGLIACHHSVPAVFPWKMRTACEFVARVASLQLRNAEDDEHREYRVKMDSVHRAMLARAAGEGGLAALVEGTPTLADALDCGGAAIFHRDRWWTTGSTPAETELDALVDWLRRMPATADADRPLYATDALPAVFPPARQYASSASGLLAVPISRERRGFLLWFRPETTQTVSWAGSPHDKPTVTGPHGPRLTPRRNFELWQESVRERASPWHAVELDAALRLRLLVMDVVVSRAEQLATLNADLSRSNEQLRLSSERLELAQAAAGIGTWEWNVETDGMHWSRELYDLLGMTPDITDVRARWRARVHPEDVARAVGHAGQALGGETVETEYRYAHPTRGERWFLSKARLVHSPGSDRLVYGATFDITERKWLEGDLRAADRRKDDFLAMLAHELRNPLAPLRTGAAVLRQLVPDAARAQQVLDMLDRQTAQLTRLIDDLLDVSRVSRGRIDLRIEVVDLRDVLTRAVEAVQPLVRERAHELVLEMPAEAVHVKGDPARLVQVVGNLLVNAAKYTDPGGRIELRLDARVDEVIVVVRDNGIGIDATLLPYVFDMFVQSERTPDRVQGGLGLGLTIVNRIVGMHGGRVEARSEGIGQGAEFRVHLPRVLPPVVEPADPEKSTRAPTATPRRILIVDDNRDSADSLAALLRMEGHVVDVSYQAEDGLQRAAQPGLEAVLLDIGLPDMDGYEIARRLRSNPSTRHLQLIALTGYAQEADRRRALRAGFDLHLSKPVDPRQIVHVLAAGRG